MLGGIFAANSWDVICRSDNVESVGTNSSTGIRLCDGEINKIQPNKHFKVFVGNNK